MAEEEKPPRVVVTEAWKKEQETKQAAYEAKRRAWAGFVAGSDADDDRTEGPGGPAAAGTMETDPAAVSARRRRRGGTIQDKRQARFTF
jgi:hypothetical protein